MKKAITAYIFLMSFFLFFLQGSAFSQDKSRDINMEATLYSVIQLNIDPNVYLEFGIKEINERLYQITKYPDDLIFSVESTEDWTLSISSTSGYFRGVEDSSLLIPVDFIGYTVESHGNNFDNGWFSNIYNPTKDTIFELSAEKTLLMTNGRRHNIGNAKDNYFVLRWKFLYQDDPLRMREFYNFRMANDLFRVGVRLTLTKSMVPAGPEARKAKKEQ